MQPAGTALNILVDGLTFGMVLFIISIGLSVAMGLMRFVNLAHGSFAMVAGYLASWLVQVKGIPYGFAIVLAVAATVALGWPIERFLLRRLYAVADPLVPVLLTIGLAFVLTGLVNAGFGPTLKSIPLPAVLTGSFELGFKTLAVHRAAVLIAGFGVAALLWWLIDRSDFGIFLRAAVDHPQMASSLGIKPQRIYALTFALAVGLAAFGGVVGAQILPIEPTYGFRYMVTFLVVVSVGGAGSIGGALAASIVLGIINTAGNYFFPDFGDFFFYLAVTVMALAFPDGLARRARL
jgi:branched-chain amino acid transport system permease protein